MSRASFSGGFCARFCARPIISLPFLPRRQCKIAKNRSLFLPHPPNVAKKGVRRGSERETKKIKTSNIFFLSFLPIRFLTEFYQERNSILTMLSRSAIRTAARSVVATNAARALNRVVSISVSLIVWGC